MKKIQYFKLFESRTARLSDEEFINLAKTKCKDFLAKPKYLQRMKKRFDGEYSYVNPKLSYRTPLMADEMFSMGGVYSSHHTLLMDNLPSWQNFPKRTQSIIGSANFGFDPSFGEQYHCVIPYDNANFALAPDCDLWNCACLIGVNSYSFDDYFSESFLQADISDHSFDDMMDDIQKIYDEYLTGKQLEISGYITRILKSMKEDNVKDVRLAFNEYFSPEKFRGLGPKDVDSKGFVTMNYSEISEIQEKDSLGNLIKFGKEFWTDSECLIVYLGNDSSKVYQKYEEVLKLLS